LEIIKFLLPKIKFRASEYFTTKNAKTVSFIKIDDKVLMLDYEITESIKHLIHVRDLN